MELLLQRTIDGLGNGSIYSAMALAIVLVFVSTGTLNFALGSMGMFSTFVVWKLVSDQGAGVALPLGILVGLLVGVVAGAVLERVFVRPVENRTDHLPAVVVTLGLYLAIGAIAGAVFTVDTEKLPSVFPSGSVSVVGTDIKYSSIGLLSSVIVLALVIFVFFQKTRLGLMMRAAVDNPQSSQLVGIRRSNMLMLGWAMAGGLGALAGILIAPTTLVHTGMLDSATFLGFAAAALGGFSSPMGALIGGLVMGLVEALAPAYVPGIESNLALATAFVIMLITLLVRPNGLFGRSEEVRV
jgi:branched-chain amino acid transport system permease protein